MQETWYAFRQTKEQEVVLYRVYGQSPVVTIPEKIAGNRVTELAAYCTNDTGRLSDRFK
jgi:hypothetical protein